MILSLQISPLAALGTAPSDIAVRPEARAAHSMTFDPYNGVSMIFGGFSFEGGVHSLGDTWIYSYAENEWTKLMLTPSPSARSNHAMVYCNETNEVILYGGFGMTDTWSFSCNTQTWAQVVTATNPGVHHSLALAYDPQENVVILFGGFGADGTEQDDTWIFDCDTREWTELFPSTSPLARYGHVMVYDESINRIVLTSGNTASQGHQDDTWLYDTSENTWTELSPTGTPDPLKWPAMVYDPVNQVCVLFGGQIGDYAKNRTWIYNAQLNTWTRFYPDDAPPVRINTGLAFDSTENIIILFGGCVVDGDLYDDTWSYSYEDNLWTNLNDVENTTTTTTSTDQTELGFNPFLLVLVPPIIAAAIVVVLIIRRRQ